ncbi:chromogranin-A isoform X1 [Xenopus laevis]|uniref:Chromogranin-A n=1 Tax=Xenopus laevis TaxID=8355 RepID=A0A8J0TI53_XENLA|nr:chromogranin-A isoform X1 [Xenopus laevis]
MLSLGVISIALCAVQVISFPLSEPANDKDTKVMKCIVEIISHSLSKPSTATISQDCLETLRGDDRIISILRRQNLLKELQELASEGATKREQKKKKNSGYEDELSEVLERQNNKAVHSEKSDEVSAEDQKSPRPDQSAESEESKRQVEDDRERKADSQQEENSQEDDGAEELGSNEIHKREESPGDEEIDNHITDEINDQDIPTEKQEDTSVAHSSEEETAKFRLSQKDAEDMASDEKRDFEKEKPKEDTNETDEEEDETQREDNSMKPSEYQDFDATRENENSKEGGHPDDETMQGGGSSHQRSPKSETSSKEMEDSKRWNKMDELAKQLTAKKWAEENTSEEDPDQSMKIPPMEKKYNVGGPEPDDRQPWQQSGEESSESEYNIAKRPELEGRKEEESSTRNAEDKDLDSIAAIEAELEKVAHKLHELRRF